MGEMESFWSGLFYGNYVRVWPCALTLPLRNGSDLCTYGSIIILRLDDTVNRGRRDQYDQHFWLSPESMALRGSCHPPRMLSTIHILEEEYA